MEIIPAIDIIEGKCVRLTQGDYSQKKVYNTNPLEVAKMFEDWGLSRLHLVDLDGARQGKIVNYMILEKIATNTGLVVDFGGGIKSDPDIRIAFNSGAAMVTGGSIAVKEPELFLSWLQSYGNDKIILGADHKEGKIAVSGWEETSDKYLIDFIREYFDKGIKKVISTDISVDGMLKGPGLDLYEKILKEIKGIELTASGGVGNMDHIFELEEIGIQYVIVGKAIYEGMIQKDDIKNFLGH